MTFRKTIAAAAVALILGAPLTPSMHAWAAYNFPAAFGPLTGDCTTPNAQSAVTTCGKFNGGTAFGSMAGQNASGVAITGGAINGTPIGGSTPAAVNGTTNAFSGFSAQTGGHQVGTVTVTAAATLTQAQESVCTNGSAAFTLTLPASPVEGQRIDVSDCGGQAAAFNVTIVGSGGSKVNYSTSGLVFNVNNQSATFTYRAAFGWIVI